MNWKLYRPFFKLVLGAHVEESSTLIIMLRETLRSERTLGGLLDIVQ